MIHYLKRYRNNFIYALAFLLTIIVFSGCQLIKPSQKKLQEKANKKFSQSIEKVTFQNKERRRFYIDFTKNESATLHPVENEDPNFHYILEDGNYLASITCLSAPEICHEYIVVISHKKKGHTAQFENHLYPSSGKQDFDFTGASDPERMSKALHHDFTDNGQAPEAPEAPENPVIRRAEFQTFTYVQKNKTNGNALHISLYMIVKNWTPLEGNNPGDIEDPPFETGLDKHIIVSTKKGNNVTTSVRREFRDQDGRVLEKSKAKFSADIKIHELDLENRFISYDVLFDKSLSSRKSLKLKLICVNNDRESCEVD